CSGCGAAAGLSPPSASPRTYVLAKDNVSHSLGEGYRPVESCLMGRLTYSTLGATARRPRSKRGGKVVMAIARQLTGLAFTVSPLHLAPYCRLHLREALYAV